jgi:hypothetical protein
MWDPHSVSCAWILLWHSDPTEKFFLPKYNMTLTFETVYLPELFWNVKFQKPYLFLSSDDSKQLFATQVQPSREPSSLMPDNKHPQLSKHYVGGGGLKIMDMSKISHVYSSTPWEKFKHERSNGDTVDSWQVLKREERIYLQFWEKAFLHRSLSSWNLCRNLLTFLNAPLFTFVPISHISHFNIWNNRSCYVSDYLLLYRLCTVAKVEAILTSQRYVGQSHNTLISFHDNAVYRNQYTANKVHTKSTNKTMKIPTCVPTLDTLYHEQTNLTDLE